MTNQILADVEDHYQRQLENYINEEFKGQESKVSTVWSSDENCESDSSSYSTESSAATGAYSNFLPSKSSRSSMIPLFQPLSKLSFSSGFAAEHQDFILSGEEIARLTFNIAPLPPMPEPKHHEYLLSSILKNEMEGDKRDLAKKSCFVANLMASVASLCEPELREPLN